MLPQPQLAEMGFQLILYPLTALFAAAWAIGSFYQKLRADGTTLGEEQRLDVVQRVQRTDRRGREIRAGGAIRGLTAC